MLGQITVLEKRPDNTFTFSEVIETSEELMSPFLSISAYHVAGYAGDNLAIDSNGALWIAGQFVLCQPVRWKSDTLVCKGLSDLLGLIFRQFEDPSELVASAALRVTVNNGPSSFYGEKYNVDKVGGLFSSAIRHRRLFSRFLRIPVILLLGSPPLCMIPNEGSCSCMVTTCSLTLISVDLYIFQVSLQRILLSANYNFRFRSTTLTLGPYPFSWTNTFGCL